MKKEGKNVISVGFYSNKGGVGKSSILVAIYRMLSRGVKDKLVMNVARATDSVRSIFEGSYAMSGKRHLYREMCIADCSLGLLSEVIPDMTKIPGINYSRRWDYVLIDFDGGSLSKEDLKRISVHIDIWIVPIVPSVASLDANKIILDNLIEQGCKSSNILQVINYTKSESNYFNKAVEVCENFVNSSIDDLGLVYIEGEEKGRHLSLKFAKECEKSHLGLLSSRRNKNIFIKICSYIKRKKEIGDKRHKEN